MSRDKVKQINILETSRTFHRCHVNKHEKWFGTRALYQRSRAYVPNGALKEEEGHKIPGF